MNNEHDDSKNDYIKNLNQFYDEQDSASDDPEKQYSDARSEPRNDFYTTEYNQGNYFEPHDEQALNEKEAPAKEDSIFGDQSEQEYLLEDDLYATDTVDQQYRNAYSGIDQNNVYDRDEYENNIDNQNRQETADLNHNDYSGYESAEQYAEAETEQFRGQTSANQYGDIYDNAGYETSETVYDEGEYEISEYDQKPFNSNQLKDINRQQQVDNDLSSSDDYLDIYQHNDYLEADGAYTDQADHETVYSEQLSSEQSYEMGSPSNFATQPGGHDYGEAHSDYTDNVTPNLHQQNFSQEYSNNYHKNKPVLPIGWVISAVGVLVVLLAGYFLYSRLNITDNQSDIPFVEADKSSIKIVPKPIDGSEDIAENTDDDNVAELPQTPEETVLNSRETVVEQPLKSDDRVEVSSNINIDNDDKDIQNVLTLLKSNVNNAEILLKPDEINVIDQNKIGVEGLETVLVEAKRVTLNNVKSQEKDNVQPLSKTNLSNVDDLLVIGEGDDDPFKQVIDNDSAVELPDRVDEPLAVDSTDALDLALPLDTDQTELTDTIKQVAINAPKPVKRPVVRNISPAVVPNSLTPNTIAGGDYGVQLASLPTEAAARQAYVRTFKRFPNILAGFSPVIKEAVVPDKGVFYRVFAGPLNSYADANALCARLRAAGINGCFARKM